MTESTPRKTALYFFNIVIKLPSNSIKADTPFALISPKDERRSSRKLNEGSRVIIMSRLKFIVLLH